MEKDIKKMRLALKKRKKEAIVLVVILLLASFLRFYKIREFIIFLGDEGRDALVVRRMIVDHDFTLLGPTASVGGFYLGPVYYYMMLPFLWLFAFDPVGPAVMVAILSVASVGLLWWAMRTWFNQSSAIIAALLYATAPGVVAYSRSSWNPNIMPFFALLSVFSVSYAKKSGKFFWLFVSGAAFGIAIQSHYLGLVLGPVIAVATLVVYKMRFWIKAALIELLGFIAGASMYLAFELRHNFPNLRSVIEFVSRGGNTTGPRSWNLIWLYKEMLRRTFESVFMLENSLTNLIMLASLVGFSVYVYRKKREGKLSIGAKTVLSWFLVGLLGIGMYKGQLYPHYFGYLFPLPFVLLGTAAGLSMRFRNYKIPTATIIAVLLAVNLMNQKIWGKGSNLVEQTERVAKKISRVAQDETFNFALISNGNSDHAYRYFLEVMIHPPTPLENEVTKQLIVVCENPDSPCEPLGHPLWEVAGFGRAEIVKEVVVKPHIKIIKLIHHPDSKDLIGKPAPKG